MTATGSTATLIRPDEALDCERLVSNRYGIMRCLLFCSLGTAASKLEPGHDSGIALIDSTWHAVIEFQSQVNAGVAIHMRTLETGTFFAAFFLGLGVAFFIAWSTRWGQAMASSSTYRISWVVRCLS